MARAGRKRKITLREPSGKVQRVYENPKAHVTMQPHRAVVPVKFRETQEAGSEFGRLMLQGRITPAQYEAGKLYADIVVSYRASILAQPYDPSAIDLGRVGKGKGEGMPDRTALALQRRYARAYDDLSKVGRRPLMAVNHYAVQELPIPNDATTLRLEQLACGLNALVSHFGIDSRLQITDRPK